MHYAYVESPVGPFLLAGDDAGLRVASFNGGSQKRTPKDGWRHDPEPLRPAIDQVEAYFAGERTHFDLALVPGGTPFQQRVWRALQQIPFGAVTTYGQLAAQLGMPRGSRAVGSANAANCLPLVIPCHRVIGASGALTGFGGGLDTKRWLLAFEGALPSPTVDTNANANAPATGAGASVENRP